MCIAIPAEVVSVDGATALVDICGERIVVDLMMMSEPVKPGDFVALQARRYAVARIAREDALAARCIFEDLFPELAAYRLAPLP
jgi:hydrogenase assembly chaperone HypC/HupF